MTKADVVGAFTLLFVWLSAFALSPVVAKLAGQEAEGFFLLVMGLVGIWAGKAARAELRKREITPPSP